MAGLFAQVPPHARVTPREGASAEEELAFPGCDPSATMCCTGHEMVVFRRAASEIVGHPAAAG